MSEHTKTPWFEKTDRIDSHYRIFSQQKNTLGSPVEICLVHQGIGDATSIANAAFIVRACNSHDALLAACKEAYSVWKNEFKNLPDTIGGRTIKQLKQAITLAEKGE